MKPSFVIYRILPALLLLSGCPSEQENETSYISFDKDCIEQKGSIKQAVERTLEEFPECRISETGRFMDEDFIYVRCGNTPLLKNNFMAVETRDSCEVFSAMGSHQKKQVLLKDRQ